jgi:hypothetical protein
MRIPSDAKNGFWLVVGGIAALYIAAIVIKRLP